MFVAAVGLETKRYKQIKNILIKEKEIFNSNCKDIYNYISLYNFSKIFSILCRSVDILLNQAHAIQHFSVFFVHYFALFLYALSFSEHSNREKRKKSDLFIYLLIDYICNQVTVIILIIYYHCCCCCWWLLLLLSLSSWLKKSNSVYNTSANVLSMPVLSLRQAITILARVKAYQSRVRSITPVLLVA